MERPTVRVTAIAVITALAAVLAGCGSDGPVADLRPGTTIDGGVDAVPAPTDSPAPTDAPAATTAPVATEVPPATEAPAVTQAPVVTEAPVAPDDNPVVPDTDDGSDLLTFVLIVGAILLAALLIGVLISRSRRSSSATGAPTESTQASLLSTSQWIADHLALELMAAPPEQARQRWSSERTRLDSVAIGAQQQYLEAHDANWQPLAQTMSALASSIDTALALRAQDPPNAALVNESIDVVNGHRARLHQLIAVLLPTITS
jgi:hypothetical protein